MESSQGLGRKRQQLAQSSFISVTTGEVWNLGRGFTEVNPVLKIFFSGVKYLSSEGCLSRFLLSGQRAYLRAHLNGEVRPRSSLEAASRHLGRLSPGCVGTAPFKGHRPIPDKEIQQTKQTLQCFNSSGLSSGTEDRGAKFPVSQAFVVVFGSPGSWR